MYFEFVILTEPSALAPLPLFGNAEIPRWGKGDSLGELSPRLSLSSFYFWRVFDDECARLVAGETSNKIRCRTATFFIAY